MHPPYNHDYERLTAHKGQLVSSSPILLPHNSCAARLGNRDLGGGGRSNLPLHFFPCANEALNFTGKKSRVSIKNIEVKTPEK